MANTDYYMKEEEACAEQEQRCGMLIKNNSKKKYSGRILIAPLQQSIADSHQLDVWLMYPETPRPMKLIFLKHVQTSENQQSCGYEGLYFLIMDTWHYA